MGMIVAELDSPDLLMVDTHDRQTDICDSRVTFMTENLIGCIKVRSTF